MGKLSYSLFLIFSTVFSQTLFISVFKSFSGTFQNIAFLNTKVLSSKYWYIINRYLVVENVSYNSESNQFSFMISVYLKVGKDIDSFGIPSGLNLIAFIFIFAFSNSSIFSFTTSNIPFANKYVKDLFETW